MKPSLSAGILFCALTACHAAGGNGPQRLVIADPREPLSLNPLLLEGPSAATINPLVYSFLLTYDDRGNLVPDVAATVPTPANRGISADGRTITYHLRHGIKWQDGAPFTARDVVFSFSAVMNPKNNVFSRFGYEQVRTVTAVDPYTVRVVLKRPYSPILSNFFASDQNYGILPEHLLRKYSDLNQVPFNANPVGSGPYRVADWARGDHLTLVRNPRYFRGPPAIAEITLKFIGNSNAILNQLRTREVNAYFFADPVHMPQYRTIPATAIVRAPFAALGEIFFNLADPVTSGVATRRAIVQSLDLASIVRNATLNTQTTKDADRGVFSWAYDPVATPPPYDPVAAKRRLQAQGVKSLAFIYESGIATSQSIAVQVQRQLANAGVDVALRAYTPQMFRAPASAGGPMFGGKFQLGFIEIYSTVDPNTQWFLSCKKIPPNGFNVMHYCDPVAEQAQEQDGLTYERAARLRFGSIVQRRVVQQLPFVGLWGANAIYVVPSNLRRFSPSGDSPYWNVWAWSLAK